MLLLQNAADKPSVASVLPSSSFFFWTTKILLHLFILSLLLASCLPQYIGSKQQHMCCVSLLTESDWRQQRLQAWEPILTASTVLPSFLLIGLLFIPTGIFLLHSSRSVQEFKLDYTDCERITDSPNQSHCIINFTLEQDFVPDVYLYYVLTNYFQNHRHYAQSRDDEGQLAGRIQDPDAACEPFRFNDDGKPIAPCGIVANSMFNDTFPPGSRFRES